MRIDSRAIVGLEERRKFGERRKRLKRVFIAIFLLTAVSLSVTACGEKEDEEIYESLQEESLDIENDAFYFVDLMNLIGEEQRRISELPGMEQQGQDVYDSQLFGKNVSIEVECDEGIISNLEIVFYDTESTPLENAISEQLGKDAEEKDGQIAWETDGISVRLDDGEQENAITIMKN